MPRKENTLRGSLLRYRIDNLERHVRKEMRRFNGAGPKDLRKALTLLIICHDFPDELLEASPAGQALRLDLVTFILRFPEYAIAGLRWNYRKPEAKLGRSAIVREFLLTQALVDLPDGKQVSIEGALDKEIAFAAQSRYESSTGRVLDRDISVAITKHVRQRLERKYGKPLAKLVEFSLASTGDFRVFSKKLELAAIRTPCRPPRQS